MEVNIKKGYSIVFLVKKEVKLNNITFKQIEKDMKQILRKAYLLGNEME